MKSQRRAAIMGIVRRTRVHSQEQLRELLHDEGIDVTQATLSRDIRELRLAKVAHPAGGSYYAPSSDGDHLHPPLEQLVPALLLSIEGVGPLLVVKTPAGSAEALGSALDQQQWPEVIGCIAGDDTMLIITRSERARRALAAKLRGLSGSA
ncbi:MAG: arginine repressor [Gemmatimonadetes bacterium]|nr:arginine repressor [Gemmatimonadota bacterium]